MAFSRYKSISINIFGLFQNKFVESKSKYIIIFGNVRRKIPKIFLFHHWNPYVKTDSANLLILFSVIEFHKKICRNFYVIFLRNVSSSNVCIALGKTQNAENKKKQNINTEK